MRLAVPPRYVERVEHFRLAPFDGGADLSRRNKHGSTVLTAPSPQAPPSAGVGR
jgi:hypothetical protein